MTTTEQLRAWVLEDFGFDPVSLEAVEHGADTTAILWRAVSADGARYAIKVGAEPRTGVAVAALLAESGEPGVPAPVRSRYGQPWSERSGQRLSVVPWVSDRRAIDEGMNAARWKSFGELLARIHSTQVTSELKQVLPHEVYDHDAVASLVRRVDERFQRLSDRAVTGVDELTRSVAQQWLASSSDILTLLNQADQLAAQLTKQPVAYAVCHADPHLGNVLLGEAEPPWGVWLVDWDDAMFAPIELDLMFVLGGVLAFAPVTELEQSWFFSGYGQVDVDPQLLAYYRCTRALVDVADPAVQVLDAERWTSSERAAALSIVEGVLSPTGLVTLAMSSLTQGPL
ncbi:MAG TPA: aminoglycoside phosphotransferase family protein [Actinomycetes bacterium]|nr:aminoglycoside phosphotransferase family protein [Actinomycetes bacterium]